MEREIHREIEQLSQDVDWKRRREAALLLGYAGSPEAYPALVTALDDPDYAVRQAAILSLGRIGGPEVVEELTKPKVVACEDPEIRRTAVSVLGKVGGLRIVEAVSQRIADPDWAVRSEAITTVSALVDWLSELRIPETARFLVRMLPIDDPKIREKAIRALGGYGRAAVGVLVEALGVHSELVRSGAAAALGLIQDRGTVPDLIRMLSDASRQVRLSAITALGNIGSARTIEPLIESLSDSDKRVRTASIEALGRIGSQAVEPLIEALSHARTEVATSSIIKALGSFRDERALVHLTNYLGHTYMTVRWAAVEAVASYANRALAALEEMLVLNRVSFEPLVRDAKQNPGKRNRLRTIRALGELKDSRAAPALKELGQEEDREIGRAVEDALAKIGSATWARAGAVTTLGRIGDERAVPAVGRCLADPNSTVRWRAARALVRIGDPSAVRPIARQLAREEDAHVREASVEALGILGMKSMVAVAACTRALSDPSGSVRSQAARALGRLGNPRAAEALVGALADSYWSVARDAGNSLANLGRKAVPSLLEALVSDRPAVRCGALEVLGAIGDLGVREDIERLLVEERDEQVRSAAEEALGKLVIG